MFNYVLKYVIGGRSGKRESALMAWLFWVGWTIWLTVAESGDQTVTQAVGMWNVATPLVWSWLGAAFGFEWWTRHKSGQEEG